MTSRPLLRQLVISFALLLLGVLVVLAVVLVDSAENQAERYRFREAEGHARSLAEGSIDALLTRDYELLERWVASARPSEHYAYAYLSRPDGVILVHVDPGMAGSRIEPPDPKQEGQLRHLEHDGRPVNEIIHPAVIGGRHIGNAHVAYYTDVTIFSAGSWPLQTLLASIAGVIAIAAGAFVIARRIVIPIDRLTSAVEESNIRSGADIDAQLLARGDEIGALAQAFDNLFHRLQEYAEAQRQQEAYLKSAVESRTRELEQSNQELKAFCYSVSHDLRTPLRALDGYAQLIMEDYGEQLDAEGHRYLDRIQTASRRMSDIIDDLLSLSRVTQQELVASPVNLSQVVEEILQVLQDAEPQRQVRIRVQQDGWISGDPRLLRVCLDNLLGNAWKFTANTTLAEIEFGYTDNDLERVFTLRDNGAGFDMSYAHKLFQPFQRLHSEEEFTGTGIGLAIVERVVKRHEGRVWAESVPGDGTRVHMAFPLALAEQERRSA